MTASTVTQDPVTEPLVRDAAELQPDDRIAAGWLPLRGAADVLFATAYEHRESWVVVVYRYDDGVVDSDHFLAEARIPLERTADDGFGYSREVEDDPTPVSPARVPLHTGSVVADGVLVTDEAVQ